jgi:L-lactate transport
MWQQDYTPIAHSLWLSSLLAALPIFTLFYLLGVRRTPAWQASLWSLASAALAAVIGYQMPVVTMLSAIAYGAAFGLFPIGWVVFTAILLFRLTEATGKFEIVKHSIGAFSNDRRLQALLIAFAFGAFIEGAAGFGTPVAVAAAMLAGCGFSPFYAAAICLLANTAPVAFGSIGIPVLTLATTTGLPLARLSAAVGRLCAPVSLFVPAYLVWVMGGRKALRGVLPAAAVCGGTFAACQFLVSNFIGPQLTDILSSLAAMAALLALSRFWKPADTFTLEGDTGASCEPPRYSAHENFLAWGPYALLVVFVLLWGIDSIKVRLGALTISFPWPALHNQVARVPPVVAQTSAYAAVFNWNWLSAAGTACLFAAILSALLLRMSPAEFGKVFRATARQLALPELTIAAVLAIAFLMNYSGATATLGIAFASTGVLFPFFSAFLGWLGVFLTGSDTSANALFGSLQVITANRLGLSPVLMAAANSSGGVMGKMISLQSIAIAAAAAGLKRDDEARLFRFVLRHSITLAAAIAALTCIYAYVFPRWVP